MKPTELNKNKGGKRRVIKNKQKKKGKGNKY
jgi:hypothetical protein